MNRQGFYIGKGKFYMRRITWYGRLLKRLGVKQKYIDKISKPYVPIGTCNKIELRMPHDHEMKFFDSEGDLYEHVTGHRSKVLDEDTTKDEVKNES